MLWRADEVAAREYDRRCEGKACACVEKIEGGYRVTVGSVEHPMTDAHYIQWIELVTPTGVLRHNLTPQDKPVAEFKTDATEVEAREYCNLHGLWKG